MVAFDKRRMQLVKGRVLTQAEYDAQQEEFRQKLRQEVRTGPIGASRKSNSSMMMLAMVLALTSGMNTTPRPSFRPPDEL